MLTQAEKNHYKDVMNAIGPSIVQAIQEGIDSTELVKLVGEMVSQGQCTRPAFEGVLDTSLFSTPDNEQLFANHIEREAFPANYVRGEEQVWAQVYAAVAPHSDSAHVSTNEADFAVEQYRQRYSFLGK